MKRAAAPIVLACLLVTLTACAKRTLEGRWHLDRANSNMPQGFNLKGESYLVVTRKGDGLDMREFVSSPEGGAQTLLDRHYTLDGKEHVAEADGLSTLYISARFTDDYTLYTTERIVHNDRRNPQSDTHLAVTYVVSRSGMTLVGTDDEGKKITYDRE